MRKKTHTGYNKKTGQASISGNNTPMERALSLLSYRQRSIKELEEKLLDRGFATDDIAPVIERLVELGFLDDRAFARDFAASRLSNKHWGSIKIARELKIKGVNAEKITITLSDIGEENEQQVARQALRKWLRIKTRSDELNHETTLKAKRFLHSKGFPFSIIHAAIESTKDTGDV